MTSIHLPALTDSPPRRWIGNSLKILAVFAGFWSLAVWTYGASCADIPRRDDLWYLAERAYHPDPLGWWTHTLSFTRTRRLAPGDYLLFRPAHYAVLSMMDLLFRGRQGSAECSFAFMGLAATSLYLATLRVAGRPTGLLLAAHFATQYPALEIVCWRHISPYLLSVACLGFGLAVIQGGLTRRRCVVAAGLWTLGSLFHEAIPVTLGVMALAGIGLRPRSEVRRGASLRWLQPVLLAPIAIHAVWNLGDYLIHRPAALAETERSVVLLSEVLPQLTSVFNGAATTFLKSPAVNLAPYSTSGLSGWEFNTQNLTFQRSGAVLAAVVVCLVPRLCRPRTMAGDTAVAGLGLLLALTLALGLGRGLTRGTGYLHQATYYYSLTAYALSLIMAGSLWLLVPSTSNVIPRTIRIAVAVWLGAMTIVGASRIRDTLGPDRARLVRWRADHEQLLDSLREHRQHLAGIVPGQEDRVLTRVNLLLLQEARWADESRGDVALALGPGDELQIVPIQLDLLDSPTVVRFSDGEHVEAAVEGTDARNRTVFRIEQHEAFAQSCRNGVWGPRRNVVVVGNHARRRHLKIATWGEHAVLVDGSDILTSTPLSNEGGRE